MMKIMKKTSAPKKTHNMVPIGKILPEVSYKIERLFTKYRKSKKLRCLDLKGVSIEEISASLGNCPLEDILRINNIVTEIKVSYDDEDF
jgi:Mg2+/Co2+ transporter CorC